MDSIIDEDWKTWIPHTFNANCLSQCQMGLHWIIQVHKHILKMLQVWKEIIYHQKKRSLHCAWFSGWTLGRLHRTWPIQNANFLALEWLELSGDFPVTFQCILVGLVSPTDFSNGQSIGISPNQQSNSTRNDWTAAESLTEVHWTPMDTKQTAFLISIINKIITIINKSNNTLN